VLEYQPFEVLCRGFGHQVMNLLQGDFKVEVQKNTKQGSWRAVAILAACAFGLHISVLLFQGIYFDVKAKDYERESRALYTEVFPDDRNVRDVKRRWRGHLGQVESGAGGGFLDLFTDTVQHLSGTSLVLNNVNFNESRGNLVLQLKAPRSDELIQFSNVLANAGLNAEIGTINQGEDSVKGSVEVKLAGGP
jgi:general secretion pathway protein L